LRNRCDFKLCYFRTTIPKNTIAYGGKNSLRESARHVDSRRDAYLTAPLPLDFIFTCEFSSNVCSN